MLDYVKVNHQLLNDFVVGSKGLKMVPLEGTYLAWVEFDSSLDDFQQKLFEAGLHVLRGEQFLGKNAVRLNLATTKSNVQKAIQIMQKVLNETN